MRPAGEANLHAFAAEKTVPEEIVTPAQMAEIDRTAIARGPFDGPRLMENAGAAVAAIVLARHPAAARVDVLCGPGNNGGDGYVVATQLAQRGADVALWSSAQPRPGSDAEKAAAACPVTPWPLDDFRPSQDSVVVDALYGAGLSKPVEGAEAAAIDHCNAAGAAVIAVDLPSGVSGLTGQVLGTAFRAAQTVTFVRRKPGHLLYPGRELCGEVIVADIGIADEVVREFAPATWTNGPDLWRAFLPRPAADTHKYRRGHAGVFSGGAAATGAARLAAMGAARAGAGAVTVLSPGAALAVNAMHLTSIMLRKTDGLDEVESFIAERRPGALVYGPGLSPAAPTAALAVTLVERLAGSGCALVVDASAVTALAGAHAEAFFAATRGTGVDVVLTPHEGEFARLFPDLAEAQPSKLERARLAAARAGATVILKGADTAIAAADGRAAINANGTPLLATAGSGDVLAGIAAGLLAQGMPAFEAACCAVWMHAEAAREVGPGLIAEDLPPALRPVLGRLSAMAAVRREARRDGNGIGG